MNRSLRPVWVLLAAVALVAVACGDDGGGTGDEAPTTTEAAAALPELDVVFADDLIDDANGWGESDEGGLTTRFTDVGYEVTVAGTANWWGHADAGPLSMEDVSTTVTVADPIGPSPRWFGVMCRGQRSGPTDYYTLLVDNDSGDWAIRRYSSRNPDEPAVLAEGETDALEGVGVDEEVEMTGTCLGDGDGDEVELVLTVDGEEIGRATDEDGLPAGTTGLTVGPADGADDAATVTFTGIEVAGDEGDADLEFVDDFSDPTSGWLEIDDQGTTAGYGDGTYDIETTAAFGAGIPVRPPLPSAGTAAITLTGDLTDGFAGWCITGEGGQYELALSSDGYASLGHYAEDGTFSLIDEVTGAWSGEAPRVTAGWNTDGASTRLDLYVDEQQLLTTVDDRVATLTAIGLCGTVSTDVPGGSLSLSFDDLAFVGEG
jgi:hypothetical protein